MSTTSLSNPAQTEAHGARLGRALAVDRDAPGLVVALEGELGAGKTCWARGLLRGLGWRGKVRSPTYTLVEPYRVAQREVYHMDLYRLVDPEELEYLSVRELGTGHGVWLVEWPERAGNLLPAADIRIQLAHANGGRQLTLTCASERGRRLAVAADLGAGSSPR